MATISAGERPWSPGWLAKRVYNLRTVNIGITTGYRRNALLLALAAASGILLLVAGPGIIPLFVMLALLYGGARLAAGPLSGAIARVRLGIRWKILTAIGVMGIVSIFATMVNIGAMDYMHTELHNIQSLPPFEARAGVDELEAEQHGLFFSLAPFLSIVAAVLALGLGVAIAVSVIDPVRRMGEGMRRIASGDFSQSVVVPNRDELGELAQRINQTAGELGRLQEQTLADERARALRERIAEVTLAQEEERRRISRELHDGLGPSLAAVVNRVRASQSFIENDPPQARRELEEVARTLKGHIQDIRHLIHDLRPLAVDQLGLKGAFQQHLERFTRETGIHASLSLPASIALQPRVEATLFRVLQECLSNIQKHAAAAGVSVLLRHREGGIELQVSDDGCGFDHKRVLAGQGLGVGLISMRERAERAGGRLAVDSTPGQGCRITFWVPEEEAKVGVDPYPAG